MARIVTDFIEDNYKQYPNKIIFADDRNEISIDEFRGAARKIATALINYNCFKKPVAIYMDKSIESIVSFLGVAYSGNFYTPLDTLTPLQRISGILEVLKPHIIISDKNNINKIREISGDIICVCYENIIDCSADNTLIEKTSERIIDTDILYIMFTSESTGIPKGVVIPHKNVVAFAEWITKTFDINTDTVFGNQTPFYFSMSILDIYATIKACATMYMIPKTMFSFPVDLLDFIHERGINTIYWVPSALCLVVNLKALGLRDISCIKKVLFSGEVMPSKQLNEWMREIPSALFANLFGATEVTDVSDYYIINRHLSDTESVPIGQTCKNVDSFILDENNNLIEEYNTIGELCIRGTSLAQGYYNNPEKTNSVFVQNPFNDSYPERVYRTGDLVHINNLGELIYDGRKDNQIKHMGHRIELGEIETAAASIDGVANKICVYDNKKKRIVLFYCGHVSKTEIKQELRRVLPEYMIPSKIIECSSLPQDCDGKVDGKLLLEQYLNGDLK